MLLDRVVAVTEGIDAAAEAAIALAGGAFEAVAVDDGDAAAAVGDPAGVLEGAGGGGNAGAADAEDGRQMLVGDGEGVAVHAVVHLEEPVDDALADLVGGVAGGELHAGEGDGVGMAQEGAVEAGKLRGGFVERVDGDAEGLAGDLDDGADGAGAGAEEEGRAEGALGADGADGDGARGGLLKDGQERDDAAFGEVDVAAGFIGLAEHLAGDKLDGLGARREALEFGRREGGEQVVHGAE